MNIREEFKLLQEENNRLKSLLKIQENEMTSKNHIEDLIDIEKLKNIFSKFSKLTGYTTGFIRQDTRDILISTGWTDTCKTYHRGTESSAHICKESNAELTKNLIESHHISMRECQHGMVDGATPIIIDGEHLADVFSGQVLFHKPNIEEFKLNAKEFGYDMDNYLKAVDKIKIISKEKLQEVLEFLSAISEMVAEVGKDKKEYLKLNALLENKVQDRVQETESLLSLFDESDNVLFKWNNDTSWSVSFVSRSVSKLLGYSKFEFENNTISYASCIHPDDLEAVMNEVKFASLNGKRFFSHKPYRVKTKDGTFKWILDNTVIVRDEKDEIIHYLGYLSDITELKDYQRKLLESRDKAIEAEKSKDTFLSNMSHEIRTPLNAIVGFVQILKKEIQNEEHKKYLSIIDESSHSLLSIIEDILDFAKLRSGKLNILKKEYDIHKELSTVLKLFKQSAKLKNIKYNVLYEGNFQKLIRLDKDRINQILSNFLSNAIKFTPENGNISITINLTNEQLLISVKDSGIGMSEEQQSRIFLEFEQARTDTAHEYGGAGLGLAISLKLAHLMQGDISVTSKLNEGTLFSIYIPVETTNTSIKEKTQIEESTNTKFNANILVAEDNESNQILLTILLEDMGIDVTLANNGAEACQLYEESILSQKKYNLILMDNNMPLMGGIEATKKIKSLQNYYTTPIVALTANALKGDREYFLANKMDDYLKKPFEIDELLCVLKKFL